MLSAGNPIMRFWKFINLMVGNSKQFNCRSKGYRAKLTLSVMTVYLCAFTFGLFAGDIASSKFVEVESIFGIISTTVVYSLGFSILYECWQRSKETGNFGSFPALVSLAMIGSQTAMVFQIFPVPIEQMIYYFGSFTTMLFVYSLVHKDKLAGKQKEDLTHEEDGFIRI